MEWILGGLAVAGVLAIVLYNRLVALRQNFRNAFADIDVQLKQRHDLVPNLVETVKGYGAHESKVFEAVTQARASAMRGGSMAERAGAEAALSGALMQLMAVAENYPQLKASENFKQLQNELSDLENKIAAARRFFNNAVAEYNISIEQFPAVLLAGPLGFRGEGMFELQGAEKEAASAAPQVKF
ncbi:MAG: LemA family protein [Alphaproteobacteria bacterium]|nr:LemA family protein [Alphaproteobacteria bacterium]